MQNDDLVQPGHGHLIASCGVLAGKVFSHLTGRQIYALCDQARRRNIPWDEEGHPTEQERHLMGANLVLRLPRVAAMSLYDALIHHHQQLLRVYQRQQSSWSMKHLVMVAKANGVCRG